VPEPSSGKDNAPSLQLFRLSTLQEARAGIAQLEKGWLFRSAQSERHKTAVKVQIGNEETVGPRK
jgi:hypothetical protein